MGRHRQRRLLRRLALSNSALPAQPLDLRCIVSKRFQDVLRVLSETRRRAPHVEQEIRAEERPGLVNGCVQMLEFDI